LAQHARDVAAAMESWGLGPSIIVGHSMGAFIATALAAQNPELVSGLILIDGGYLLDMPAEADAEQVLDAVLAQRITQLQETYPSREVYREFWRQRPNFPAADWGPWTEAFLNYEVGGEAPLLRPKASEAAVRFDVAESFKTAEITARLEALRVPVLLLRAAAGFALDRAQLIPDAAVELIRSILPDLVEETIPGTTHYTIVLGERGATRVADLIDEFAQRCETRIQ
jgi:pimeloyl-ACP methyl ester carboxylesterase